MIFITNKKQLKYIKKLNAESLNNWISSDLKALSFTELKNPTEILSFINNCSNYCEITYYKEKIENILVKNKYLAYIYYKNDNPLGYLISYIKEKNDEKILEIESIGILEQYKENQYELDFIKSIIYKAWEKKAIDNVTITFESPENKIKKIMKELNFKRI